MQFSCRKITFSLALIVLLAGSGFLFWHYVLYPPIHPEFSQTLFKQRFSGEDRATSMKFNNNSQRLLVGMESGVIHVWDTTLRNKQLSVTAHQYRADSLTFTENGNSFFSNSYFEDSTRLWDSSSGQLLATIPNARGPVAMAPADDIYLIGGNGDFFLYELQQRQALPGRYPARGSITALAASPVTGLVAIGTASGSIQLWQFSKPDNQIQLTLQHEIKPYATGTWLLALGFSADGTRLISANRYGSVTEWNSADLSKIGTFKSNLKFVHEASFSDGMHWLTLTGTLGPRGLKNGKVELINLHNRHVLQYAARSSHPIAEMIEPLPMGFIAHGRRITGAAIE